MTTKKKPPTRAQLLRRISDLEQACDNLSDRERALRVGRDDTLAELRALLSEALVRYDASPIGEWASAARAALK